MGEFIAPTHILKELEGDENWGYEYVEPIAGENVRMKDTETRDKLLAARELLYQEYEDATREWIQNYEAEEGQANKARRDDIARRLRDDYWKVDPYIRARSLYDRTRVLQADGKLDYYPRPEPVTEEEKANGTGETRADDVD